MDIKLDAKSVELLFPEGTEARLNLQQCVLNEMAKRVYKTAKPEEIRSIIHQIIKEDNLSMSSMSNELTAQLRDMIARRYSGFHLTDEVKRLVIEQSTTVSKSVNREIIDQILTDAVTQLQFSREDMVTLIDERIAKLIKPLEESAIDKLVESKVTERISAMYKNIKS